MTPQFQWKTYRNTVFVAKQRLCLCWVGAELQLQCDSLTMVISIELELGMCFVGFYVSFCSCFTPYILPLLSFVTVRQRFITLHCIFKRFLTLIEDAWIFSRHSTVDLWTWRKSLSQPCHSPSVHPTILPSQSYHGNGEAGRCGGQSKSRLWLACWFSCTNPSVWQLGAGGEM